MAVVKGVVSLTTKWLAPIGLLLGAYSMSGDMVYAAEQGVDSVLGLMQAALEGGG